MNSENSGTGARPGGVPEEIAPGRLLKDRYLLEKELGRGGMGVVYLARDQQLLSKPVVVKVLLEESATDPWLQQKFRQEAEALARIDHPGVVGILDFGATPEGRPFLVMQFVEGVTLRSEIRPGGLEFRRVADLLRQAGQALGAAHEKGIWHRDLKPENVMLQDRGQGEEHVKLIDFGIAAVKDSQMGRNTQSSRVAGSFGYMAPEQLMGRACAQSDIYALGTIAHEMLTGRRPEITSEGLKDRPADLRSGLPPEAEQVLRKALAFHPEERYERPRDFTDQLAQCLTGATVVRPATRAPEPQSPTAGASEPSLEMAYVLFTDLVDFSTRTMEEQARIIQELQGMVRQTQEFQRSQANGQVLSLPTGDGMALVFFQNPVAAVQCAVEVARALHSSDLKLRMGVHTGPVYRFADINTNRNVTGGGINLAQRVMDCGDAGHILISKSVADILGELGTWVGHLHDLGLQEVKHGVKVHLVNLYSSDFGNPEMPQKLRPAVPVPAVVPVTSHRGRYMLAGGALALTVLIASAVGVSNWRKTRAAPEAAPAPAPQLQAPAPAEAPPVTPPTPPTVVAPAAVPPPVDTPRVAPVRRAEATPATPATPAPPQAPTPIQQPSPVVRVPAPAAPPAPAPPAAAAPSGGPDRAALQEARERMILLSSRAGGVRGSLENLQREQSRSGLSLRGDMAAAAQRVQYLMGEASAALAAGNAAAAKRNLDQAEANLEKLEKFLGL